MTLARVCLTGCLLLVACGGTATTSPAPSLAPAASASAVPASEVLEVPTQPLRIDRYGLTIPLPDRDEWSLSFEASEWAVLNHLRSRTTIRLRRFEETSLAGQRECVTRAQLSGAWPREEELTKRGFETLADELVHRPKGWDGRRWIALEQRPAGGLLGHVLLAAGRQKTCIVVHAIARAESERQAEELADQLIVLSSAVVGGVRVDEALGPERPRAQP